MRYEMFRKSTRYDVLLSSIFLEYKIQAIGTVGKNLIRPPFSEKPMFLQVAKSKLFVSVTVND